MTTKPYPFTPEQEAWLRDLETTEAPQTRGALHRLAKGSESPEGYCCLGRACVVLGIEEREGIGPYAKFGEENADTWLPGEAIKRLHLRTMAGTFVTKVHEIFDSLTAMNDGGWNFKQIAAYIRANPENVFLPPEEDKE